MDVFHFVWFLFGGFLTFSYQCWKIENCRAKDGLMKGKQREQIIRHVLYFWWWGGPVAPSSSQRSSWNFLEHSSVRSDGIPRSASAAVNYIQTLDFTAASAPHECSGAVPSSVSVPSTPSLHPGTMRRTMPGCRHIKRWWETERRERRRESGGTDAERRNTMRAETWLGIKAKLNWWKKNFLLNWLYTQEKKNRNLTLSSPSSLRPVSHGANCLRSTSVYVYMLLSKPVFAGADPTVQFIWRPDNTPKSFINPRIMYSFGTIGFQRANSLENGPNLFSLWSLDSLFHICGYHPCWFGWVVVVLVVGRGGVPQHIFSSLDVLARWRIWIQFHGKSLSDNLRARVEIYDSGWLQLPGRRARRNITPRVFLKLENTEINGPLGIKRGAVYWLAIRKVPKECTKNMRKCCFIGLIFDKCNKKQKFMSFFFPF